MFEVNPSAKRDYTITRFHIPKWLEQISINMECISEYPMAGQWQNALDSGHNALRKQECLDQSPLWSKQFDKNEDNSILLLSCSIQSCCNICACQNHALSYKSWSSGTPGFALKIMEKQFYHLHYTIIYETGLLKSWGISMHWHDESTGSWFTPHKKWTLRLHVQPTNRNRVFQCFNEKLNEHEVWEAFHNMFCEQQRNNRTTG